MGISGWKYYNHAAIPTGWPHETPDLTPVRDGSIWNMDGKPLFTRWTEDFDCGEETEFYYCIKDSGLDISSLKAKRRYEINRGNKNYEVRLIRAEEYTQELYDVYVESLEGYSGHPIPEPLELFASRVSAWPASNCALFGAFDRETGRLCGYSDVWIHGRYLPISSLTTRPSCEKSGVNFALVSGIIEHFSAELESGAYLCDGARNVLHETNFQPFLMKYFGFRKAYCHLRIQYRPGVGLLVHCLFPFRKWFAAMGGGLGRAVSAVLKMEAWQRGLPE